MHGTWCLICFSQAGSHKNIFLLILFTLLCLIAIFLLLTHHIDYRILHTSSLGWSIYMIDTGLHLDPSSLLLNTAGHTSSSAWLGETHGHKKEESFTTGSWFIWPFVTESCSKCMHFYLNTYFIWKCVVWESELDFQSQVVFKVAYIVYRFNLSLFKYFYIITTSAVNLWFPNKNPGLSERTSIPVKSS